MTDAPDREGLDPDYHPIENPPWLLLAVLFYVPLTLLSGTWIAWREGTVVLMGRLVGESPGEELAVGAVSGLAVVMGLWILEPVWSEIRRLANTFSQLLGGLSFGSCVVLASVSAVGEELFFRGVLHAAWGLVPAAALFALLHFPIERGLLLWPFFALGAGLLFGLLFERTGAIAAPAAAHFVINLLNLVRLARRARASDNS